MAAAQFAVFSFQVFQDSFTALPGKRPAFNERRLISSPGGADKDARASLPREQEPKSPFVFVSERGDPFSNRGFQATVERAGKAAGFGMKIYPHMLRHACGYKLANDGVDTRTIQSYLGHKSISAYGALYRAGADAI